MSLTDEIRTLLYRSACDMFKKGEEKKVIKSPDCEAVVRTEFQFAMIGYVGGTKFTADVESNAGKTYTSFIVHDRDLNLASREGVWVSLEPIPEHHPAAKAVYN